MFRHPVGQQEHSFEKEIAKSCVTRIVLKAVPKAIAPDEKRQISYYP